jgi:hypothetical protein
VWPRRFLLWRRWQYGELAGLQVPDSHAALGILTLDDVRRPHRRDKCVSAVLRFVINKDFKFSS